MTKHVSDSVTTVAGRTVTYPRLKGRFTQRIVQLDAWLLAEGIREAAANGDVFVREAWERLTLPLSDGDRADLNDYLFAPGFRLPMMASVWHLNP